MNKDFFKGKLDDSQHVALTEKSEKCYMVIDLKSFYASVECVDMGLDPMTTRLVVADPERERGTICLAITPAMKKLGIKNRCRVFEIPEHLDYITAPPRMQRYIDCSAEIYGIYLKYIAKEDIHVYSIDEAFFDVTDYQEYYQMSAKEIGQMIIQDIYQSLGITATCGIGTNLYLAKVALDITAKHVPDHIGVLDEASYQKQLWNHKPLTDFWRVGAGTAKRLATFGIQTMGELAKMAEYNEEQLYKLFGVDAELLIDHAYGRETTTIADIKNYKSHGSSISSGQVLMRDYEFEEGRLIVKEMTDLLCLDLVDKGLITDSVSLYVGYSHKVDSPGAKGTVSLRTPTSSAMAIRPQVAELYDKIVNPKYKVRRMNISFNRVTDEAYQQYDLFTDSEELEKEKRIQKAMLEIKNKFGKNAVLKGMNLEAGGTTIERNCQIGGHKSGI